MAIPQITPPEWWTTEWEKVEEVLGMFSRGTLVEEGRSAGNLPIYSLTYSSKPTNPTLLVIAGVHGHETGGLMALLAVATVLEVGVDPREKRYPEIERLVPALNLVMVPCFNPDARRRCPPFVVGMTKEQVERIAYGVGADGQPLQYGAGCDPEQVQELGGLYDDEGFNPVWDSELVSASNEVLVRLVKFCKPHVILELHERAGAHCFMTYEFAPPQAKMLAQHFSQHVRSFMENEGWPFADDEPLTGIFNATTNLDVIAQQYGAVPLRFEGRAGILGSRRPYGFHEILESNLSAITCVMDCTVSTVWGPREEEEEGEPEAEGEEPEQA